MDVHGGGEPELVNGDLVSPVVAQRQERVHGIRELPGDGVLASVSGEPEGGHEVGVFGVEPLECLITVCEGQRLAVQSQGVKRDLGVLGYRA